MRVRPRHDANAEQYAQKQTRDVVGIDRLRNSPIVLAGGNATAEEAFDCGELCGDHRAAARIVGGDLKRRIDEETALPLPIFDGMVDDFGEKMLQRLSRRERRLKTMQPVACRAVEIALQRLSSNSCCLSPKEL